MRKALLLAASGSMAAALAACSPPSSKSCSQSYECSLSSTCDQGLCRAVAPSRFLYVANNDTSTISRFTIDNATGTLALAQTMPSGSGPTGLVMHPNGKFLIASNSNAPGGIWGGVGSVSVFSYDAGTGVLADVAGSPFTGTTMALNVAVTPDGRFVYTTDQKDFQVAAWHVDAGTGALAQAPFSPMPEYEAHSVVIHPSGKFVYVGSEINAAGTDSSNIKAHLISSADGSLTAVPGSPYANGMANNWMVISADGRFLYTTDTGPGGTTASGNIRVYSIDGGSGALTEIASSPLTVPGGEPMHGSALTPHGDYYYVGLWNSGTVRAFKVDHGTGALTEIAGSPFTAGTHPKALATDAHGKYLFVANYSSANVSVFTIDPASGALSNIGTYPLAAGAGPKTLLAVQ